MDKFTETERAMVTKRRELVFNGFSVQWCSVGMVSYREDEKVLEMDSDRGYATM